MSSIHPSRLQNIPQKKKKKLKPPKPQPASTSLTRAQLRKKIRDLTRLLSTPSTTSSSSSSTKGKLPATARIDTERALAAYKLELSSQQQSSKVTALQKRYHKVRFFERRKASRLLSRLHKQKLALSTSPSATTSKPGKEDGGDATEKELDDKIHQAEIDLNYIMHYPPLEKYISLYKPGTDKSTNEKRENIRKDIEQRMRGGTLERGDRLMEVNAAEGFGTSSSSSKKKRRQDEEEQEEEDEGSDGGFFE
ncbi:18S rRNA maturation protein [Orbilia ellipsospora]|uniref:rRNA-processing protein EFG1 n=1 Tax=Orbilia ellipsospora TaxID=2528407 RepID=A0AAV9WRH0_9PEZI